MQKSTASTVHVVDTPKDILQHERLAVYGADSSIGASLYTGKRLSELIADAQDRVQLRLLVHNLVLPPEYWAVHVDVVDLESWWEEYPQAAAHFVLLTKLWVDEHKWLPYKLRLVVKTGGTGPEAASGILRRGWESLPRIAC